MQPLLKKSGRSGIMFDTNIFNQILDDKIILNSLPKNFIYYVTFVQKGEIEQTSDGDRRNKLLQIFKQIKQKKISTETSLYGWGPYGEGKYGALGRLYPGILKTIKQPKKISQIIDCLDKKNLKNVTENIWFCFVIYII